jgi:hypothetical protein
MYMVSPAPPVMIKDTINAGIGNTLEWMAERWMNIDN